MKIGIMGAMEEEIQPFLDQKSTVFKDFKKIKDVKYGDNVYHEAEYKDLKIILAYSKIGKVNAALTASTMTEKFGADAILFTGVAGAVKPDLKIGDLIAANSLCQHDLDITSFGHPYGYVPGGSVYVKADEKLLKIAHEVALAKNLNLQDGVIATGDQFVASKDSKEWISKTFKADAIEMEGAAVAVVCDALNIPFFVLRAISDAADMDARFSFDAFLEDSAKVSSSFVIAMLEKINDGQIK